MDVGVMMGRRTVAPAVTTPPVSAVSASDTSSGAAITATTVAVLNCTDAATTGAGTSTAITAAIMSISVDAIHAA
jgi:hypothetical protein